MDCLFWHGPRVTYDTLWLRRGGQYRRAVFLLLHPVWKNQRVGMFRRLWVCGRQADCSFMDRAFRAPTGSMDWPSQGRSGEGGETRPSSGLLVCGVVPMPELLLCSQARLPLGGRPAGVLLQPGPSS